MQIVGASGPVRTNPMTRPVMFSEPSGRCLAGGPVSFTQPPSGRPAVRWCQGGQGGGIAARAIDGRGGGERYGDVREQPRTRAVHVVGVLVVGEQYGVNRADVLDGRCRPISAGEGVGAAGDRSECVERRGGRQPRSTDVAYGRSADQPHHEPLPGAGGTLGGDAPPGSHDPTLRPPSGRTPGPASSHLVDAASDDRRSGRRANRRRALLLSAERDRSLEPPPA